MMTGLWPGVGYLLRIRVQAINSVEDVVQGWALSVRLNLVLLRTVLSLVNTVGAVGGEGRRH